MQPYSAAKQWNDGFGANETRITAADLTHIEAGISAATQGVTNVETRLQSTITDQAKKAEDLRKEILAAAQALIPIGTILMFGGNSDPAGWVRCDGRLLERAGNAKLFAAIGTIYGSTTSANFRVPDFRDRFPAGAGTTYNPGAVGGLATVALTEAQMPRHAHEIGEATDSARRFEARTANQDIGIGSGGYTYLTSVGNNSNPRRPFANFVGSSQAHENRPPYLAVPFIIKVS
uniref:Tail collar protein n=1 Tax=Dulem virus 38 TaxID=3145756 RepID=A0AAU8B0H1_9CAUD